MTEGEPRRTWRALARPPAVVGVVATLVGVGHGIWIWQERHLGGIDPDEAGYLATAMRIHRAIAALDPVAFVRSVGGTAAGPIAPLVSQPFLLLGPDDPRTAMLAAPLLMVVAAVGIAAITERLAGPVAAVAAGIGYLAFPTVALAAQSYWLGSAVAASMVTAMWLLLSSDRCEDRRRMLAFGVALAVMLLSRTMAIGFLPAMVLAGVVVAGRDRRRLRRLGEALAVTVLVAGPWWVVGADTIFDYLLGYGYGDRAGLFGSGDVWDRLAFRFKRVQEGVGPMLTSAVGWALVAALVIAGVRALGGRRPPWTVGDTGRGLLASGVAVAAGLAALVSTSNAGVWFELPLFAIAVPVAAAVLADVRVVGAVVAVVVAVQGGPMLARTWWLLPYDGGLTAHYELAYREYDRRFEPTTRELHAEASADWWRLTTAVERRLRELVADEDDAVITLTGNMEMFNTNTVALAAQLEGWSPLIRIPDTVRPRADRLAELTPTAIGRRGRRVDRVLVVAEHDLILFPPDMEVDRFVDEARDRGWREVWSRRMPTGGRVAILLPGGGDQANG